jgi:hypothetical protein
LRRGVVAEPLTTDQLLGLYKVAIDEYRFEVKLNWDRTAYHLTLNSGLLAVATGLLKVGGASFVDLFVAVVFFIGICAAIIGINTIKTGHEYYRRTIVKIKLFEDQLDLTKPLEGYQSLPTLSIGTTTGQREHHQIVHNTEEWVKRFRLGSVKSGILFILIVFCLANTLGFVVSLWLYWHSAVVPHTPPAMRFFFPL